ncbi:MAG: quinoprotein dehydrogenase-associated putative ABC transporter substrate-binding protein [Acidobacteria bacterium]|nr:quinoprotein dehydrogenase-associated putative ABC transporter substrate-binding protein [Acidobacteriota bacterium]
MYFRSLSAVILSILFFAAYSKAQKSTLRVCADPNNLPFSNTREEGFENRIAHMAGLYLGEEVEFVWQRMGRGFVREYIDKGKCDVVIGVPTAYRPLLTTQPYYRSSFVFLIRKSAKFRPSSLDDPQLKNYRIAIEALEEEYTPPAQALARRGLQSQLVGIYSVGEHNFDVGKAVSVGRVDLGIMWGPTAGYFAKLSPNRFSVTPIEPQRDGTLPFAFSIAMGVAKTNQRLHERLNQFIEAKRVDIQKLLAAYGVPQLSMTATISQVKP